MTNPVNSSVQPSSAKAANDNLLDVVAANGNFKTFVNAVDKAGLTNTLRGPGPFTVFAPTDKAFEQLPSGRLAALLAPENKTELAAVVNYHIVSGRKTVADMGKWETARTVNGQPAPMAKAGESLTIDGAKITTPDIASSNGLIHGIDKVIMPTPISTTKQ